MSGTKARILVILGMHRSGTSAVTRGMEVLGVDLGDNLIGPIAGDNDKGFWEDADLNRFNDELLGKLGSAWDRLAPVERSTMSRAALDAEIARASKLLARKTRKRSLFAFKDPRTCLLLWFWQRVFSRLRIDDSYVIVFRNPLEVAESLKRRDGIERERGLLLWSRHVVESVRGTEGRPRVFVQYESMLQSPASELRRVARALDLPPVDEDGSGLSEFSERFLTPRLRRNVLPDSVLENVESVPPSIRDLYRALQSVTSGRAKAGGAAFSRRWEALGKRHAEFLALLPFIDQLEAKLQRLSSEHENALKAAESHQELEIRLTRALGDLESANRDQDRLRGSQAALDERLTDALERLGRAELENASALTEKAESEDRAAELLEGFEAVSAENESITRKYAESEAKAGEAALQLEIMASRLSRAIEERDLSRHEQEAMEAELNSVRELQSRLQDELSEERTGRLAAERALAAESTELSEERTGRLAAERARAAESTEYRRLSSAHENLRREFQTLAATHREVLASRSWRVTEPVRSVSFRTRNRLAAIRTVIARPARRAWRRIPMPDSSRVWLRNALFSHAAGLFRWSNAYREWVRARTATSDTPLKPGPFETLPGSAGEYVADSVAGPPATVPARVIAFYFPQYHAIPENDRWWGEGFTEWSNVRPARPQFEGHWQPRVPGDLGYYDATDATTQVRQVDLAKRYGIGGFCFYFYWFGGKRLLETPIAQYLNNADLDLPFCLCWANENWTRTWDGTEDDVLIAQAHSIEDDLAFIEHVAGYMRDPRYIRINDKPLLLVYRPSLLPDAWETSRRWRTWARENGIGDLYLAYTQSFEKTDPAEYGFDAAVEFPPNNSSPPEITRKVAGSETGFRGKVYDWRVFPERSEAYARPPYTLFPGVCPGWDNTARRKSRSTIFLHSEPALYKKWLVNAVHYVQDRYEPQQRLVFANAWNEWAEGAYLEPDARYGYAFLKATREALEDSRFPISRSVLIVLHDCHPHGAQLMALALIRSLSALGVRVVAVTLGGGRLLEDFRKLVPVTTLESASDEDLLDWFDSFRAEGVVHAITNTVVSGRVVPMLRARGFRVLSLIHEMPGLIREMGQEENARIIARDADVVVFAAPLVADRFAEITGLQAQRSVICPQGLVRRNPYRSSRGEARQLVGRAHGLSADAAIVLGVGYLDARKGGDLFVDVARRVVEVRPDAVFIWVGHSAPDTEVAVRTRVRELGLGDHVILTGFVSDPSVYYAASSVYALTSREDPFPSVVLEAIDVGLPVVAFDGASGCGPLIRESGGRLARPLDVEDFAARVVECIGASPTGSAIRPRSMRRYAMDLLHHLCGLPRVSVVVPNYNYERHIGERLDSIRSQTFPVYEVVVLDDASMDASVGIIRERLSDWPVDQKLVVNDTNSGSAFRQWLEGAKLCTGDLLWIAEADDVSDPRFLDTLVTAFQEDPSCVLAYCQSKQIDEEGRALAEHYLEYTEDVSDQWVRDYRRDGIGEIRDALSIKNTVPNVSAVLFRADAFRNAVSGVGQRIFGFQVGGDWLLYLYVLRQGGMFYSASSLNSHRRHMGSITTGADARRHVEEVRELQQIAQQLSAPAPDTVRRAELYIERLVAHFDLRAEDFPERKAAHS